MRSFRLAIEVTFKVVPLSAIQPFWFIIADRIAESVFQIIARHLVYMYSWIRKLIFFYIWRQYLLQMLESSQNFSRHKIIQKSVNYFYIFSRFQTFLSYFNTHKFTLTFKPTCINTSFVDQRLIRKQVAFCVHRKTMASICFAF